MQKLITVGKHKITGEPVFIETAMNGLKCNADCPECGRDFEARQGNTNDWSFTHNNSDMQAPACTAAYETALHFISKWIIAKGSRIKLPAGKYFDYTTAIIEKSLDRFRIDVQRIEIQKFPVKSGDEKPILNQNLSYFNKIRRTSAFRFAC